MGCVLVRIFEDFSTNGEKDMTDDLFTIVPWSESGSFASPVEDDIRIVKGSEAVEEELRKWVSVHERIGAEPLLAQFLVLRGAIEPGLAISQYPDYVVMLNEAGEIDWHIA